MPAVALGDHSPGRETGASGEEEIFMMMKILFKNVQITV